MYTKTQIDARDTVVQKMKTGQYCLVQNPCPCKANADITIATLDRYKIPVTTVMCNSCGLVRTDPYYDEKSLNEFYNNEYRTLYTGSERATENFFSEQKAFGSDIVQFLSDNIFKSKIQNKKVFEIGCGAGGILEAFRENDNEVFGCDYGEFYVNFGKTRGLNLITGNSTALNKFGTADIVILNHTLEHMIKPETELATIKNLLKPNGVLYIALPGIYSIHDTYRGNIMLYLQNAHVWYFTLKTLSTLLSKAGFKLLFGNEMIMSAFTHNDVEETVEPENSKNVLKYLTKTRRFRWYYTMKKFSLRHTAFETLRTMTPLYIVCRIIYRKLKKHV